MRSRKRFVSSVASSGNAFGGLAGGHPCHGWRSSSEGTCPPGTDGGSTAGGSERNIDLEHSLRLRGTTSTRARDGQRPSSADMWRRQLTGAEVLATCQSKNASEPASRGSARADRCATPGGTSIRRSSRRRAARLCRRSSRHAILGDTLADCAVVRIRKRLTRRSEPRACLDATDEVVEAARDFANPRGLTEARIGRSWRADDWPLCEADPGLLCTASMTGIGPNAFNPCRGRPSRFAPIVDADGRACPPSTRGPTRLVLKPCSAHRVSTRRKNCIRMAPVPTDTDAAQSHLACCGTISRSGGFRRR